MGKPIEYTNNVKITEREAGLISPHAVFTLIKQYLSSNSPSISGVELSLYGEKAKIETISGVWVYSNGLIAENITQTGSASAGVGSFGSQYLSGMLDTNFTSLADDDTIKYNAATSKWLNTPFTTGTVSVWGDIGGTLSNQTDLQATLDLKIAGTIATNQIAYGTGAETIGGSSTFIYTGDALGAGTATPLSTVHVYSPLNDSGLKGLRVGPDSATAYLKIGNASSAGFSPSIFAAGVDSNDALSMVFSSDTGSLDTGTAPAVLFDARRSNGVMVTRPLFAWKSYTTTYMTMMAGGNLSIGNTNNVYKLDVSGTIRSTSTVTATNFIQV